MGSLAPDSLSLKLKVATPATTALQHVRIMKSPKDDVEMAVAQRRLHRHHMARAAYYSPVIDRLVVCALYHEGKHRRKPMTQLVNELLCCALQGTKGWQTALDQNRSIPTDKNLRRSSNSLGRS